MVLARALAEHCVAPLVFDDRPGATEILAKLERSTFVARAVLLDRHGQVLASYERPGAQPPMPPLRGGPALEYRDGFLHVFEPVHHRDAQQGTLYLAASSGTPPRAGGGGDAVIVLAGLRRDRDRRRARLAAAADRHPPHPAPGRNDGRDHRRDHALDPRRAPQRRRDRHPLCGLQPDARPAGRARAGARPHRRAPAGADRRAPRSGVRARRGGQDRRRLRRQRQPVEPAARPRDRRRHLADERDPVPGGDRPRPEVGRDPAARLRARPPERQALVRRRRGPDRAPIRARASARGSCSWSPAT